MTEYVPLAFAAEALYPPINTLTASSLRDCYNKLAEPCRFTEFKQVGEGQGARLAENNNRHLTIMADRFVYRDEFTQSLYGIFCEDVLRIIRTLKEHFQVSALLHSKVLVRLLMPKPVQAENASNILQNKLLSGSNADTSVFERPLSGLGIRLVFPPTQEQHSTFQMRIEPYYRDQKMFYLEVNSQFFDPIVNIEDLQNNLDEAYNFARDKGGPFLNSLLNSA